jgi:hypothetical protein
LSFSWFYIGYWVVPSICKPELNNYYLSKSKHNKFRH